MRCPVIRVLLPLPLLAACVAAEPEVDPFALPPIVLDNLPAGVSVQDVGLQGGCYVYDAPDGTVRAVVDDAARPVCRV